MIIVEAYSPGFEKELFDIHCSAIRDVCCCDYSKDQINAWLPGRYDADKWKKRIEGICPYIAKMNGEIAGYADIQENGYIDHFFVGSKFQSKGVGALLMATVLRAVASDVTPFAHVSITAKPFFEKNGFVVVKEHAAKICGIELKNYIMEYRKLNAC